MQRGKKIIPLVCLIALALAVTAVTASKRDGERQQAQSLKQTAYTLPRITSKVKHLKIVNSIVEDQGTPNAMVAVELRNNSNVGVTGFTFTYDESSVGTDGGLANDDPAIVIEPHGATTFRFPLSNLLEGETVVLAAATYADGTEEGHEASLGMMREIRAREKAKRDKQKGSKQH
jgi:hypothetical protein